MKLNRLFLSLALAVCGLSVRAQVPTTTVRSVENFRSASVDVVHSGTPGRRYGLEVCATPGLGQWELLGATLEELPGRFRGTDRDVLRHTNRFYRIAESYGAPEFAWMGNYPLAYVNDPEVDPDPRMTWRPYPLPGARYKFELFEAIPNGDGGWAPIYPPLMTAANLLSPSYQFRSGDPNMVAGGRYLYRVSATLWPRNVPGRFVPIIGHGLSNSTERSDFVLVGTNGTDWAKVLKLLEELAAKKKAIADALAQNPLVEEAKLYEQLLQVLKNHDMLISTVKAILEGRLDTLNDPETAVKALCYLQKLIEFLANYDTKLSKEKRDALKKLAARLGELKKHLEGITDPVQKLQEAIDQIRRILQELQNGTTNPLDYLTDAIKDRLIEKLKEMLARKIGAKAAGALISVLQDLANLTDVLIQISTLEDLTREYNRILLEAIQNDTSSIDLRRTYTGRIPADMEYCEVTLSYKKKCWKRNPDGGPYDGTWETSDVPFSDGTTSKSGPVGSFVEERTADGKIKIKIRTELDAAGLRCPHGAGPCIVYCEVTYRCTNPASTFTIRLFVGVIKC